MNSKKHKTASRNAQLLNEHSYKEMSAAKKLRFKELNAGTCSDTVFATKFPDTIGLACKSTKYEEKEKKRIRLNDIRDGNVNKQRYVTYSFGSQFKSQSDVIHSIVKRAEDFKPPEEVKILNKEEFKDKAKDPLGKISKAAMLCRKYKNEHYILKRFCKRKLTEKMADLVFRIVSDIKEAQN